MISHYETFEGDGTDPGLGELSYDGSEYGEMDEFGERINYGSDEVIEDTTSDERSDDKEIPTTANDTKPKVKYADL
jgi:hypothetical protein